MVLFFSSSFVFFKLFFRSRRSNTCNDAPELTITLLRKKMQENVLSLAIILCLLQDQILYPCFRNAITSPG